MKRMYKQIAALLLLCALLLTGCGGKGGSNNPGPKPQTPDAGETALASLRSELAAEGMALGVAYLGGYFAGDELDELLEERGLTDVFPFLEDMDEYSDTFVQGAGYELYLIVPAAENTEVSVKTLLLYEDGVDYYFETGEELYWDTVGNPIVVLCNESDILPNIEVYLADDAGPVYYSPQLSGMDGRLSEYYGVKDITPYDLIAAAGPNGAPDQDPTAILGSWFCMAENENNEQLVLQLDLLPDGTASYSYGALYSEIYESFEGEWYTDGDSLTLELMGGPYGPATNAGELWAGFCWQIPDGDLVLEHTAGDPLLYGADGWSFFFTGIDPAMLASVWQVSETDAYNDVWHYDLQLNLDGTAYYTIYDDDAAYGLARWYGTWYRAGRELSLSLELDMDDTDGREPNAYFEGEYYIYDLTDSRLGLEFVSGYSLSGFMEENGYDVFANYYYEGGVG
ncbi:MAG: hypothetical protein IKV55_06155 [Oscillospiraceae bacterium]|nr:hypothetical protein [Oscillospiraceae bacterium]